MIGSAVITQTRIVLECNGTEIRLVQCFRRSQNNENCYPLFVNCSAESEDESERREKETDDVGSNIENDNDENEDDEDSVQVGLGAIVAMGAVTLFMTSLVLVSGVVIFCLWCPQRKRKRVVVQQIVNHHSQQHTLHISPDNM